MLTLFNVFEERIEMNPYHKLTPSIGCPLIHIFAAGEEEILIQ